MFIVHGSGFMARAGDGSRFTVHRSYSCMTVLHGRNFP